VERAELPDLLAAEVDPSVQIVLAGIFPSPELGKQTRFTKFLEILFDVKGIGKSFDVAGFHPYARTVQRLRNQIKTIRKLMRQGGVGGKPLWITELGWGSAEPYENRPLIKGIEGQRLLLEQSFQLLNQSAAKWKLAGVVWYSFRDPGYGFENCPFCASAGLFDVDGNPKPAWFSYVQATGGSPE
jgi:Glycosyl hydrolase catalytic core